MKNLNKIGIIALLLFSFNTIMAQSPHKMSYQAVVRNSTFALVVNAPIGMKISILQGSAIGTAVYVETQTPTTNANGLATIEIGGGTVVSGVMSTINWGAGPFFIKTETDPTGGTTYSIVNTTQFLSVPYALFALNSGTAEKTVGNCMECHAHDKYSTGATSYKGSLAEKRDNAAESYKYSLHAEGETAMGEGTNPSCAGCHASQGFDYRIKNKLQPTFVAGTAPGTFAFSFNVDAASSSNMSGLPGHIGCFSCHKGNPADSMALVTKDSVRLLFYAMPGKEKYFNLTQNNSKSNLCVNCHQARPITQNTTAGNGSSIDYPALSNDVSGLFYDSTKTSAVGGNKVTLNERSIGHYGWPGNVLAGTGYGPIEIPGPTPYTNSAHTMLASCVSCHMASPSVINGEPVGAHTFKAVGNYKGCNVTGCHSSSPLTANSTKVTSAVNAQKANLDTLATLLISKGKNLMKIDTAFAADGITRANLWYKFTTKHFSGGINIGTTPGSFAVNNLNPAGGLVKFPTLTNGQFGAMQAFTVAIKEYSGGIHNTQYTNALLTNAIWYLRANPIP